MPKEGWDHVSDWYDKLVGDHGHYYHQHLILPKVLQHLKEKKVQSVLDLGCGQGVLARAIAQEVVYWGVDLSPLLIAEAKRKKVRIHDQFRVQDLMKPFELEKQDFDAAALILTLQDLSNPLPVFQNAWVHLKEKGVLIIVLNHPCFRIPRQSSWTVNEESKNQARVLNRYLTPLAIPIQTSPGRGKDSETVTHYHQPISSYSKQLREAGFVIELIEEWVSDKESTGKFAKMENRAREEFPLFLCFICQKRSIDKHHLKI